ncbi:hypothetical protein Q1W71_00905 [Flavobacterium pectinovorum]|uniref:hypothetical protein n=1 Tax=Flavobacterium pectinovorum TaxID=29533 RepID=UPI00265FB1D2|nr:hypothetical protein [Flavobacterium pectinovorum]WKL48340.1 hypothetical protein Q1W71_00905 [Flavobacterium pectinovorum]
MSIASHRKFLLSQLNETKRLLSLVESDVLMSYNFNQKIKELEVEIAEIPDDLKSPTVKLLFSGSAVKGSEGIKTSFISKTLQPFQELVKTQAAILRHGGIGKRGKTKGAEYSELYLTALPRGSFGVELSQMESYDLFGEEEVAEAISKVIDIVEATTKDEQTFEEMLESLPSRNLTSLKSFLKNIDEENSILKMESGSREVEISKEKIHLGFERINHYIIEDQELVLTGILRGVLLEGGVFEFIDDETGYTYKGHVSSDISEDKIENLLNKHCQVHLKEYRTQFISGKNKTLYELLDVIYKDK